MLVSHPQLRSARLCICLLRAVSTPDAIATIPLDRWDCDRLLLPGVDANTAGTAGRFGGFVDRWAGFDDAAFGVSPSEAALMDPQQRVLLEVCSASRLMRLTNYHRMSAWCELDQGWVG